MKGNDSRSTLGGPCSGLGYLRGVGVLAAVGRSFGCRTGNQRHTPSRCRVRRGTAVGPGEPSQYAGERPLGRTAACDDRTAAVARGRCPRRIWRSSPSPTPASTPSWLSTASFTQRIGRPPCAGACVLPGVAGGRHGLEATREVRILTERCA